MGKGGDLCCTYRGFSWERWGWPLIYEEAGAGCFTVDSLLMGDICEKWLRGFKSVGLVFI